MHKKYYNNFLSMKTVTAILITLLVCVVLLFGITAARVISGPGGAGIDSDREQEGETEGGGPPPVQEQDEPETGDEEQQEEEIDPTRISEIEIYLDGFRGEGIFLGSAKYGLTSKEAYAAYGEHLSQSGFLLVSEDSGYDFEPGSVHYLYIYTYIPEYGWEYIRQKVTVDGQAEYSESIELHIDSPPHNAVIEKEDTESLRVSGWSADLSEQQSTGIERVEIYLNGPGNFGRFLGEADYGIERQDVANAYGNANYTYSGYKLSFDAGSLEEGTENTIYVYSYSKKDTFTLATRDITIEGERDTNAVISAEIELGGSTVEVSGWAVSLDELQQTGPRDTELEYATKRILFVSNKNGNEDIFIMELDGSGLKQLTRSTSKDAYPSPSPDGKKIAYTADIDGYWQIMVMDLDGENKVQLTDDPVRSGYPTWSFDGRYIYYEVETEGDWEIYRMNSDGSSRKRLTFNPDAYDWHPFAHPYRQRVIYESGAVGHEDLYIMDYDGDNIEKISKRDARKRVPCMSVDGEYIAFMGYEGETRFVYIMDGDGENIRKISDRPNSEHPFISPDNRVIAFNSYVDGQSEIFIINMDGSGETRLTSIPGDDWGPAFVYQLP
jgi:Tol biopolymer transport system component